jgi:hypothetical protein
MSKFLVSALCATLLVGCIQPTTTAPAAPAPSDNAPRVFFVEPLDQAAVASPLTVKFGAEDFAVVPAGSEQKPNEGHLHVMVDAPCIKSGQGIPKDKTHIHYGRAQMETTLELSPGEHTLCLQAADTNHIALEGDGMTHTIKVTVK